jgi:hypothetical protein
MQLNLARFHLRHLKQIINHRQQIFSTVDNVLRVTPALGNIIGGLFSQISAKPSIAFKGVRNS